MSLLRNVPTPEGRALGAELVRLIEPEVQRLAAEGVPDERCSACAFRAGTFPNGCPTTVMDALKCALESKPFYCHMGDKPLCHGWYAARFGMEGKEGEAPWPFSELTDTFEERPA